MSGRFITPKEMSEIKFEIEIRNSVFKRTGKKLPGTEIITKWDCPCKCISISRDRRYDYK